MISVDTETGDFICDHEDDEAPSRRSSNKGTQEDTGSAEVIPHDELSIRIQQNNNNLHVPSDLNSSLHMLSSTRSSDAMVPPKQQLVALRDSTRSAAAETTADTTSTDPPACSLLQPSLDGTLLFRPSAPLTLQHCRQLLKRDDSQRLETVSKQQIHRVRLIHDRFYQEAGFSFNYNTLLLVSSVLAGLGLVSNSTSTIIASMLVSPLMGPVIGIAYGRTIMDHRLVKRALYTETISLLVCLVVGCLIGLTTGPTNLSDDWPTPEMLARGSWTNFFVACPVAFFSGLAVSVGVMDDHISSLVGVAISASLLPPAVNAGVLWVAHVFVQTNVIEAVPTEDEMLHQEEQQQQQADNSTTLLRLHRFLISPSSNTDLPEGASQYARAQYLEFGGVSMAITISNILLIIIASIVMFRVKEVLPIKKVVFWEDLRIARKIYQQRAVLAVENEDNDDALVRMDNDTSASSNKERPTSEKNATMKCRHHHLRMDTDEAVAESREFVMPTDKMKK